MRKNNANIARVKNNSQRDQQGIKWRAKGGGVAGIGLSISVSVGELFGDSAIAVYVLVEPISLNNEHSPSHKDRYENEKDQKSPLFRLHTLPVFPAIEGKFDTLGGDALASNLDFKRMA